MLRRDYFTAYGAKTESVKAKNALPGDGRRPDEKADLWLLGYDDRLDLRSESAQLYQHDSDCGNGRRRHRVHDNAQRAVRCVGLVLVHVRSLRHSKKRQQNEAHHSHRRQKTGAAALSEEMCLRSSQTNASTALFYRTVH